MFSDEEKETNFVAAVEVAPPVGGVVGSFAPMGGVSFSIYILALGIKTHIACAS